MVTRGTIPTLQSMSEDFVNNIPIQHSAATGSLNVDVLIRDIQRTYASLKGNSTSFFPELSETLKSAELSVYRRNEGNSYFKKTEFGEALLWYSRSVAAAIERSRESALAYANRSAVLFRMREYMSCLLDINRALEGKYPDHLKEKLLNRKRQCLLEIRRMKEDDAGMRSTFQIKGDETDPEDFNAGKLVTQGPEFDYICCKFKNSLIPNASSKIELECNEKWGRFMVASENIETGEILSIQKMFLLYLDREEFHKKCSYCISECNALIPCLTCCDERMYCSRYCRTQAYNLYHRTECKMSRFEGIFNVADFTSMAIKIMLIGTEQGTKLRNLMKKLTIKDIFVEKFDPTNKPFVNDYLSYLNLCRTYNPLTMKGFPLFFAVNVLIILQKLDFFEPAGLQNKNTLDDVELFTIMLLMNHVISLVSNRFQITPNLINSDGSRSDGPPTQTVGINSLHNMINHSCDPNALLFPINNEQGLLAIRPIKEGEQIFISYCYPFSEMTLTDRKEHLSGYLFDCSCEACVNRWPLMSDLQKRKREIITENIEQAALEKFLITSGRLMRGRKLVDLSDDEIFQLICLSCDWLHANLKKPALEIYWCEQVLMNYFMWFCDVLGGKRNRVLMIEQVDKMLTFTVLRFTGTYL